MSAMNSREYYQRVMKRLKNCYQFAHYVVATGEELAGESSDPIFPSIARPVDQLGDLALRGLQVHLPVVGDRSRSVLMPLDIEIFLADEQHRLYTDRQSQNRLFELTIPCFRFIEDLLRSRGMPYLLDYTPSGGHILFQNILGYRATEAVRNIGYVEQDLARACAYIDPQDIRRRHGISLDAAAVFNGLGKLAEYMALLAMETFRDNESRGLLPVTISDSLDRCINFDNTWSEGSPFMRTIRSPFSLHCKNREKYGNYGQPPLVDVIGTYFDGAKATEAADINSVLDCMWDLEKAADHARRFTGYIPCANETLIDFINEYKESDLYLLHRDFDGQDDIPRGRALEYAKKEERVPDWTRHILHHPNPSALQPKKLIGFVHDFLIGAEWKPRHIANILRDMYQNPAHGWIQDFIRYPAEEKANFWARTYSAVALWRTGRLRI